MTNKLVNNIEAVFDKIEQYEKVYRLALAENKDYDTLKNIRIQISTCKKELQQLELSLWNELRKSI